MKLKKTGCYISFLVHFSSDFGNVAMKRSREASWKLSTTLSQETLRLQFVTPLLPRIAKKNIDILNKQFWVPFIHEPEQKTKERRERVLNRERKLFYISSQGTKNFPQSRHFYKFSFKQKLSVVEGGESISSLPPRII